MKIIVSAGEVSGDVHGAYLVRELKKLDKNIQLLGMGSEQLAEEGVDIRFDIIKRGSVGILEALPNVFPIYFTFQRMKKLISKERPDLVLLIDSQGFNVPLASFCKKIGIKTVYYVAPQEWLWGTERGVKKIASTVDLIIAIFKKEFDSYKKAGARVVYFGHPLLDIVKPSLPKDKSIMQFFPYPPSGPIISLCPGSRIQEIRGLLPTLLKTGELIQKEFPRSKFLLPVASTRIIEDIFHQIGDFRPKAIVGQTYDVLNSSDLAICTSGTINLEASLLKIPNIMVYRLSPLTYFIGKYILRLDRKLPYFSMPNLLLNRKLIPELVMQNANPAVIAASAISILENPCGPMLSGFDELLRSLGSPGVIPKVASEIIRFSKS